MKRLMHMFRRNDIIVRIYLSFVVVLALTVTLIGVIFLKLYENNYIYITLTIYNLKIK